MIGKHTPFIFIFFTLELFQDLETKTNHNWEHSFGSHHLGSCQGFKSSGWEPETKTKNIKYVSLCHNITHRSTFSNLQPNDLTKTTWVNRWSVCCHSPRSQQARKQSAHTEAGSVHNPQILWWDIPIKGSRIGDQAFRHMSLGRVAHIQITTTPISQIYLTERMGEEVEGRGQRGGKEERESLLISLISYKLFHHRICSFQWWPLSTTKMMLWSAQNTLSKVLYSLGLERLLCS